MTNYEVVFQISNESYKNNLIIPLIIAVICFFVFLIIFNFYKKKPINRNYGYIIGLVGFCILFLFVFFENKPYIKSKNDYLNKIIEKKEFNIIEGKVENFHPMPYEGHDMESFTVKGIYFEYSDFVSDYGFNNTSSHGGPIKHNGQEVRLFYFNKDGLNHIIKIEIKQNP